ncbi:hypothetical protein, partial [Nonomuraea guangzhouensis]
SALRGTSNPDQVRRAVNVLTDSWSWQVFAIAAALLVIVAVIAYRMESTRKQEHAVASRTNQVAAGPGARITASPINATGADVDQVAESNGQILNSGITAENATVRQRATKGGLIDDSPIIAE